MCWYGAVLFSERKEPVRSSEKSEENGCWVFYVRDNSPGLMKMGAILEREKISVQTWASLLQVVSNAYKECKMTL